MFGMVTKGSMEQWSYGIKILAIRTPRVEIRGFPRNPRSADLAGWIRIRVPRNAPLNPRGGGGNLTYAIQHVLTLLEAKHDDIAVAYVLIFFCLHWLYAKEDLGANVIVSLSTKSPKKVFLSYLLAFLKRLLPLKWLFLSEWAAVLIWKRIILIGFE